MRINILPLITAQILLLILLALGSLYTGAQEIRPVTIFQSLVNFDSGSSEEIVIRTLRYPRLLAAIICGVSFAVAGALMQGVTNNPMASPSVLGINAGASFGLAIAMILFPFATLNTTILFSFVGAAVATAAILLLSTHVKRQATPVYLAIGGVAISAVFTAVTQLLVVLFDVAQDLSYWTAGGISGIRMEQICLCVPWTITGFLLAIYLSKSITLLNFGDDVAVGLGIRLRMVRVIAGITVLILSGSAVSLAGPIGFVGLIAPHIARSLVGIDYRKVIPLTAILGAVMVVLADIITRVVNPPYEIPLGAVTALVGVPFFIYLANRAGGQRQ